MLSTEKSCGVIYSLMKVLCKFKKLKNIDIYSVILEEIFLSLAAIFSFLYTQTNCILSFLLVDKENNRIRKHKKQHMVKSFPRHLHFANTIPKIYPVWKTLSYRCKFVAENNKE
eukprot:snap_masked-scaffold_1-processed-gene-16.55-mRNA-1 protein AED:1.00 eAED:1.00 QI:0/0/0/0/1/1/2/0/113